MNLDLDLEHPKLAEILVDDNGETRPMADLIDAFDATAEIWGTRDREPNAATDYLGRKNEDRLFRVVTWGTETIAPSMLTHRERLIPRFR